MKNKYYTFVMFHLFNDVDHTLLHDICFDHERESHNDIGVFVHSISGSWKVDIDGELKHIAENAVELYDKLTDAGIDVVDVTLEIYEDKGGR